MKIKAVEPIVRTMQKQFWQKKVDQYVKRYDYGQDNEETFISNMLRMGYSRKDVEFFL